MATVVIGTAGHIDHGKTTLLRALTGIDADRLPEERERGMTIDVGFAHLDLDDGTAIDFVDVPGHDRLVGNMLVGAGEIDGVLLVIAADDGPRAQTLEHLELLDALGLRDAVIAVTKIDAVEVGRVDEVRAAVRTVVDRTGMAGAPIVAVSGLAGAGLGELRARLVELRDRLVRAATARPAGPIRLPIDRAFAVRGRGTVVTGTLRGGSIGAGTELRLVPGGERPIRVREVQVHHGRAERGDGGRTALNLASIDAAALRRGQVLAAGPGVEATDRLLVTLRPPIALRSTAAPPPWPPKPGAALRLHLWTDAVDAAVAPTGARWLELGGGTLAAGVRLAQPVAAIPGAQAVLRDPGSGRVVAGVTVLDTRPPRGISRRRVTAERLGILAAAVEARVAGVAGDDAVAAASTDLHGLWGGTLAADLRAALGSSAVEQVGSGVGIADLRAHLLYELRRAATVGRQSVGQAAGAIDQVIDGLVASGRLRRQGDRVLDPSPRPGADEALATAMARLETALDVDAPPSLADAARAAGCPPEALRELEAAGRIVRVEDDLAWTASRHAALRDLALELARRGPLSPAAFRDAIGGNRRIALAFLEDLGRRGLLRRTDAGHVLGPRAPGPR